MSLAPSASAADQLTASFAPGFSANLGFSGPISAAQTFTPEVSGALTKVELPIWWSSATGNPTVVVTAVGTDGKPTGMPLASQTIAFAPPEAAGTWSTISFTDHPTLTAGTQYAVVASYSGYLMWSRAFYGSSYAGGAPWDTYVIAWPISTWYSIESFADDLPFRVYVGQSDATAPVITITTPADGAFYKLGANVLADFGSVDETGGSGVASTVGTVTNGAAIDTATAGSHTFTVTATDNAGNPASKTVTYTVDGTAPAITITTPAAGAIYPLGAYVLADYGSVDDTGGSGVASTVGSVPVGNAIDTSTAGSHTFTVNATDNVGNSASKSVTYTVKDARQLVVDLKSTGALKANLADAAIKLLDKAAAKAGAGQNDAAISLYRQVKGQVDGWYNAKRITLAQHDGLLTAIDFQIAQLMP